MPVLFSPQKNGEHGSHLSSGRTLEVAAAAGVERCKGESETASVISVFKPDTVKVFWYLMLI